MCRFFVVSLLIVGLVSASGCSSMGGKVQTSFTETVTDENGFTDETGYKALSKAGMFGTLDTSSHQFKYDWGGENSIASGQEALGQDNTGNQAVIAILGDVLSEVIVKLVEMQAQQAALRQSYLDAVQEEAANLDLYSTNRPEAKTTTGSR